MMGQYQVVIRRGTAAQGAGQARALHAQKPSPTTILVIWAKGEERHKTLGLSTWAAAQERHGAGIGALRATTRRMRLQQFIRQKGFTIDPRRFRCWTDHLGNRHREDLQRNPEPPSRCPRVRSKYRRRHRGQHRHFEGFQTTSNSAGRHVDMVCALMIAEHFARNPADNLLLLTVMAGRLGSLLSCSWSTTCAGSHATKDGPFPPDIELMRILR